MKFYHLVNSPVLTNPTDAQLIEEYVFRAYAKSEGVTPREYHRMILLDTDGSLVRYQEEEFDRAVEDQRVNDLV